MILMRVNPDELPLWLWLPLTVVLCAVWAAQSWREANARVDRMIHDTKTKEPRP